MPWAPAFCTVWMARFMARRNATRRTSWSQMPWAISAASSSGCLISWMLSWIRFCRPVISSSFFLSRSASAPRRPMTMPGPGGVDVDTQAVPGALDLDAADGRRLELRHQVVADLPVLDHEVAVVTLLEPTGLPVRRDPEPEPVGVYLLAHLLVALLVLVGSGRLSVACRVLDDLVVDAVVHRVRLGTLGLGVVRCALGERLVGDLLVRLRRLSGCFLRAARSAWPARRRDSRPDRSARRREASTRRDRLALTASMRRRRSSSLSAGSRLTMMVMWQVRLRILVARPRARGRQRFMVEPSSA